MSDGQPPASNQPKQLDIANALLERLGERQSVTAVQYEKERDHLLRREEAEMRHKLKREEAEMRHKLVREEAEMRHKLVREEAETRHKLKREEAEVLHTRTRQVLVLRTACVVIAGFAAVAATCILVPLYRGNLPKETLSQFLTAVGGMVTLLIGFAAAKNRS